MIRRRRTIIEVEEFRELDFDPEAEGDPASRRRGQTMTPMKLQK